LAIALLSKLIVQAMSSNADETMPSLELETPAPVSVTTPLAAAATTPPPTAPPATPATATPATDTDTANNDVPALSAPSAVTGADAENAIDVDNEPLTKNTFTKFNSDRELEWSAVFLDRYKPKKGGKAYDHFFQVLVKEDAVSFIGDTYLSLCLIVNLTIHS
jgi:hypothetical protein